MSGYLLRSINILCFLFSIIKKARCFLNFSVTFVLINAPKLFLKLCWSFISFHCNFVIQKMYFDIFEITYIDRFLMFILACWQYLLFKNSIVNVICAGWFCYVSVCNGFPGIQNKKLPIKTIKLLLSEKRHKNSIFFKKEKNIRNLEFGSKKFNISYFFWKFTSGNTLLLHELSLQGPKQNPSKIYRSPWFGLLLLKLW